ncbi:MAG: hypothetical protein U0452_16325 [Anaerolineae bacterium]
MRDARWLWLIAAVAMASCLMPWLTNPAAGLSLNPDDLAEWTSLAPSVLAQTPPLFTTFLLRTPLLIVALFIGLAATRHRVWVTLLILVLAAAQLPPFEFLKDSGNSNYRQQLLMAVLTAGLGMAVLFGIPRRFALTGAAIVSILGLAAALVGTMSALRDMQAFALPVHIGPGVVLYSVALISMIAWAATTGIKKRRVHAPLSQST